MSQLSSKSEFWRKRKKMEGKIHFLFIYLKWKEMKWVSTEGRGRRGGQIHLFIWEEKKWSGDRKRLGGAFSISLYYGCIVWCCNQCKAYGSIKEANVIQNKHALIKSRLAWNHELYFNLADPEDVAPLLPMTWWHDDIMSNIL